MGNMMEFLAKSIAVHLLMTGQSDRIEQGFPNTYVTMKPAGNPLVATKNSVCTVFSFRIYMQQIGIPNKLTKETLGAVSIHHVDGKRLQMAQRCKKSAI